MPCPLLTCHTALLQSCSPSYYHNFHGNKVGNNSKGRLELRELKVTVYVKAASVQVITQDTQDFMDRPDTDWDIIHKLAAEQKKNPKAADAPHVAANVTANAPHAPPVGENGTAGTGESNKTKLAKRVKLARSTDLWCLSPFTPVTQEAMDKTKKVCLVNLWGEVCTASNCGNKHPKVCLVADHSKGKIPKVACSLWHMRVPFARKAGNVTGRRNGPNPSPGSKGSKTKARPAKLDAKLVKLEATAMAKELKSRIRAAKMMLQGVLYSQMVQAQAPVYVTPAPTSAPAPAPAPSPPRIIRTALTPDKAIAIFLETI
jgi:hypothetical protein